ncbi:MAG: hypothetical protein J0M12_17030 [Deltaproteobacteria bacterium]|nr:hypothetical protein [Deltaproteobacteria bacterium]
MKRYLLLFLCLGLLGIVARKMYFQEVERNFKVVISKSRIPVQHVDAPRDILYSESLHVDVLRFENSPELTHYTLGALGLRSDYFLDVYGNFEVREPGSYAFGVKSDDGFRLLVDGTVVLDSPNPREFALSYGEVVLAKGKHSLEINYFQGKGSQGLIVGFQLRNSDRVYRLGEASPFLQILPYERDLP